MTARWHHVMVVVTILAVTGCGTNDPHEPNDGVAFPVDADNGNDQPHDNGAEQFDDDNDHDESGDFAPQFEPSVPDRVYIGPLLLSGRFGSADGMIEGDRFDRFAVSAVLNLSPTLSRLDIHVDNQDDATRSTVQVQVYVDYSDVSRSDPDSNADDPLRLPVMQPDEVVATTATSVGSCRMTQLDKPARALVTCDLGDLTARSQARVSIEFVNDDRDGSIDLVVLVAEQS